jgi:hypothetical protein
LASAAVNPEICSRRFCCSSTTFWASAYARSTAFWASERPLLAGELLLPLFLLGELAVEVFLLLRDPFFQRRDLLAAQLDPLVELDLGGEDLFLRLDRGLPEPAVRGLVCVGEHAVGFEPDLRAFAPHLGAEEEIRDQRENDGEHRRRDRDRDGCVHFGSLSRGRRSRGAAYTISRKRLFRRGFWMWKTVLTFNEPLVSYRVPRPNRGCRRLASAAQGVVQFSNEALRPNPEVRRFARSTLLRLVKIVRDVQGSEDGDLGRVHRRCSLGHFFHSRVDQPGKVVNVVGVALGTDVVGLAEDLDLRHAPPLVHSERSGMTPFNG